MGEDDDTPGPGDDDDDDTGPGDDDDDTTAPGEECNSLADAGSFTLDGIAEWKGDSQAAYSFIHDDYCSWSVRGIQDNSFTAMEVRGLRAGLGTIAGSCDEENTWSLIQEAEELGHEIVNHSMNHPAIDETNWDAEVHDSKDLLEEHTSHDVDFFVFPYDFFTGQSRNEVENAGHLGARGGNRDDNDGFDNPPINGAAPTLDFEVEFDVWPRTYSKYALYHPEDMLTVHVTNAIDSGGWAVREFHSVIGDGVDPVGHGFGPIELTDYEIHLDMLADAWESGHVWTAPPSEVLRYRHAREACDVNLSGDVLVWDTGDDECVTYATPLTVVVETSNDVASLEAVQGELVVNTRKLGSGRFAVTANPMNGDIILAGCDEPGLELSGGSGPATPQPAESVCDIVTVTGNGSDGAMDDLERPVEEFQVLPNPSQADGRDGSWSWYPQTAEVGMVSEGSGTVLRYGGNNLGAWTGVTLAFLGGNGAGTCYDAGAYTGLRFDIKGNVTSSDLGGQVILSLVTAETQTQLYGGDLDGAGGHFNTLVPVSSAWNTVEVAFNSLNSPTWGDTTSLNALAVEKLQAIDWGISNQATSFEVFLDNIELY